MKYARLTKEQFESLHVEFINFLATQSITGDEWAKIKTKQPEVAEQELDVFSDLVWQGVLSKAAYLENIDPRQLFLFKIEDEHIKLLVIKILDESIDITTSKGYAWLQENYHTDAVEFFKANKEYSDDKEGDLFTLIQQGANITKGELYNFFVRFFD